MAETIRCAPTTLTVGGVDFALIPDGTTSSSLGILQTAGSGTSFDIPVNISGGTVLNTLINSTYGVAGDTVGTVEVKGTGGADADFNLVEGTNIRDYNNDGYNNTIAPGTPSASFGSGQIRLDMQTFVAARGVCHSADHGHHPHEQRWHTARKSVPGGGDRDDRIGPVAARFAGQRRGTRRRQHATTTVVSGSIAPGSGLDRARPRQRLGGTGRRSDERHDADVRRDGQRGGCDPGRLQGRRQQYRVTARSQPPASIHSPRRRSADGSYTAKVTFTPSGGSAVTASVGYTIDTKAPDPCAGFVYGTGTAVFADAHLQQEHQRRDDRRRLDLRSAVRESPVRFSLRRSSVQEPPTS